jgi:hypothetical protein
MLPGRGVRPARVEDFASVGSRNSACWGRGICLVRVEEFAGSRSSAR